jgi:hypothetical protein
MVIDAIRYTEDPSRAPLTAESFLKDMLLQRDKCKDLSISPNRVTISSILLLWSRSGLTEALQKVEQHLATLEEFLRNFLTHNNITLTTTVRSLSVDVDDHGSDHSPKCLDRPKVNISRPNNKRRARSALYRISSLTVQTFRLYAYKN